MGKAGMGVGHLTHCGNRKKKRDGEGRYPVVPNPVRLEYSPDLHRSEWRCGVAL